MNIKAKCDEYRARIEELTKYREQLAAEHAKIEKTLIALSGAVEALDELLKEEAPTAGLPPSVTQEEEPKEQ